MVDNDDQLTDGVGRRVRAARKLSPNLTQEQLANRMHVSASLVRKVEQGKMPASPQFVAAAARALGMPVHDLYGQPYADPLAAPSGAERVAVSELRRVLIGFDDAPEFPEPASLEDVETQLATVSSLYLRTRYGEVTMLLPGVLQALLGAASGMSEGHQRERAFGLLATACGKALATSYKLGYLDLAAVAAERGDWAAQRSNDPLLMAMADYHRALVLLYSGVYNGGQRVILRAYDRTKQLPEDAGLFKVRGSLHLRAALLAARAGDPETASTYFQEAGSCMRFLEELPAEDPYGTSFDQDDLAIHSVALPLESSNPTAAVEQASKIALSDSVRPSRIGHHWIDVSRAWLLHGNREQCLDSLHKARRIAPQLTRFHPQVREILISLAEQDRHRSMSLARFARWAGIRL